jgi:hypothetical protein
MNEKISYQLIELSQEEFRLVESSDRDQRSRLLGDRIKNMKLGDVAIIFSVSFGADKTKHLSEAKFFIVLDQEEEGLTRKTVCDLIKASGGGQDCISVEISNKICVRNPNFLTHYAELYERSLRHYR